MRRSIRPGWSLRSLTTWYRAATAPSPCRTTAIEAILRLAQLAADFPQRAVIEINPLPVLPDGQGAVAVDVRVEGC